MLHRRLTKKHITTRMIVKIAMNEWVDGGLNNSDCIAERLTVESANGFAELHSSNTCTMWWEYNPINSSLYMLIAILLPEPDILEMNLAPSTKPSIFQLMFAAAYHCIRLL